LALSVSVFVPIFRAALGIIFAGVDGLLRLLDSFDQSFRRVPNGSFLRFGFEVDLFSAIEIDSEI
jgi:hypothetical protein